MRIISRLKDASLRWVGDALGRHAILLPAEARDEARLLDVDAPYRVDGEVLRIALRERARGRLSVAVLGYEGHAPSRSLLEAEVPYAGPAELRLELGARRLWLDGCALGTLREAPSGRRFAVDLALYTGAITRRRRTGHYLPADGTITAAYYAGETYADHEAESAGEAAQVLRVLGKEPPGPLLEVGCATGGLLAALERAGHRALGVDISAWAVEQANRRLGATRAFRCDPSQEPLPEAVQAAAPFSTLLLWAVLEHFVDPFATLARLSTVVRPGGRLVLNTTNADSLSRHLFGAEWEGHFDGSHFGVEHLSVRSLRERLPQLGWSIEHLATHQVWDGSADPLHATVREWYANDARFRRLLAERERGDLITCVARKAG